MNNEHLSKTCNKLRRLGVSVEVSDGRLVARNVRESQAALVRRALAPYLLSRGARRLDWTRSPDGTDTASGYLDSDEGRAALDADTPAIDPSKRKVDYRLGVCVVTYPREGRSADCREHLLANPPTAAVEWIGPAYDDPACYTFVGLLGGGV